VISASCGVMCEYAMISSTLSLRLFLTAFAMAGLLIVAVLIEPFFLASILPISAQVTALEALAAALPDLDRRHPDGVLQSIAAYPSDIHSNGRSAFWEITVQVIEGPQRPVAYGYGVRKGQVGGPLRRLMGGLATRSTGLALSDGLPLLIDSPMAVQLADEAGATTFRARTGAPLNRMIMQDLGEGRIGWELHYWRTGTPSLIVRIDAISGAVISILATQ
jgi:hypothetical protein